MLCCVVDDEELGRVADGFADWPSFPFVTTFTPETREPGNSSFSEKGRVGQDGVWRRCLMSRAAGVPVCPPDGGDDGAISTCLGPHGTHLQINTLFNQPLVHFFSKSSPRDHPV